MSGFLAGGNIQPSRFVKQDTSNEGKVLICGAGEAVFGVSGEGSRKPPLTALDDGYHAISGGNCKVYRMGEECYLEAGGNITVGANLKSGALGVAVATVTNLDIIGATALTAGASGDLIRVKVLGSGFNLST